MGLYVARRLLAAVPTMLVVYTITFAFMHATPGGPWDNGDKALPPQVIANLSAKYRLNDPLWKQYVTYLAGAIHGNLGPSYSGTARDVSEIIRDSFPVSVTLGIIAMAFGTVIGISLGIVAALRRNSWIDYVAMVLAVGGIATPSYVMATLLVFVLGLELRLLPVYGWGGVFDVRIVIPALALSLYPAARLARYTRSSMLEVLHQDYIRTALAKGLRRPTIVARHMLKNAMIPVVTIAGIAATNVIMGSFFVETIYGVPGIGRFFVNAALGRDYPVLMGMTLLYATVIILANLIVDLSYVLLDPRVTYT